MPVDWLNDNASAVTALFTVFLVLITAVYVALTYLLLREQRRQMIEPRLTRLPLHPTEDKLRFCVQNLGPGAAVDVALQAGPGHALPPNVRIDNLGTGSDLGASDTRTWWIEWNQPYPEKLRLVLSYHDRDRRKLWFEVFEIKFAHGKVGPSASWSGAFSTRKLKRKIFMKIPMKSIPSYFIRHWRDNFATLLVEEEARRVLSEFLGKELEEMLAWGKQYESVMRQI